MTVRSKGWGYMAIYFEENGNKDGATILFIHGGGVSSWMWKKQLEYFKDYHCIILDLPEHGLSVMEGSLSIEGSAEVVKDIIKKHANRGKAHVVGHSLGAKIVIELITTAPELIDHAVVASALFNPIPFQNIMHKLWVYKLTVSMMKVNWISNLTIKRFDIPKEIGNEKFRLDIEKYTAERLYRIYNEVYQKLTLPQGLEQCRVKTLVISGEKELGAMKKSVKDIIKQMHNAKGIYINKAEHNYPWAMSEVFNKVVASWLKDEVIEDENIIKL